MITIGDSCPDCGEPTTDYNRMAVCSSCYERSYNEENPREKCDDDGVEYADPRDYQEENKF